MHMKKFCIMMGVLVSFGMFSACSNSDEMNSGSAGILPISEEDGHTTISDFFNSELPSDTDSKSFFIVSNQKIEEDICKVINSREELQAIYSGDKVLPEIDFQCYTLVIGQTMMPALGYRLVKQELITNAMDQSSVLNLYVKNIYEYKPAMIAPLYFWGIYPKMDLSVIKINVIM